MNSKMLKIYNSVISLQEMILTLRVFKELTKIKFLIRLLLLKTVKNLSSWSKVPLKFNFNQKERCTNTDNIIKMENMHSEMLKIYNFVIILQEMVL